MATLRISDGSWFCLVNSMFRTGQFFFFYHLFTQKRFWKAGARRILVEIPAGLKRTQNGAAGPPSSISDLNMAVSRPSCHPGAPPTAASPTKSRTKKAQRMTACFTSPRRKQTFFSSLTRLAGGRPCQADALCDIHHSVTAGEPP